MGFQQGELQGNHKFCGCRLTAQEPSPVVQPAPEARVEASAESARVSCRGIDARFYKAKYPPTMVVVGKLFTVWLIVV